MAFQGRDPVRTKIVINNKIIEILNLFSYIAYMISHQGQMDIDNKLNNILKITVVLNNVFRPKKPLGNNNKTTQYIGSSGLVCGSETWAVKVSDDRRITAAEMKYMRRTEIYTCTDYRTNAQNAKELK